ncbi:class II aldolase and Adducin N-terminal domain-containing protein [Neohortaea acidophila]|uniref:Class II aldolase and Adducin N-terminal domain-containing protein n=1 Tax=Neohortaea acidophila TaxID=245834 RepID=A0A6A6PP16_9PEZI|nr:class II aldolase and Adducin N-terminal domain-containing protein [Neohortaea acidophila]KAF2481819.1 class II aldolase and Adducin N-terminal domain-containing protein [Neohortaea acidophila]
MAGSHFTRPHTTTSSSSSSLCNQSRPATPTFDIQLVTHKMSKEDDNTTRQALLRASKPPPNDLFATLITANHILHYHNVVDAYGHISVRSPQDPTTFYLSRSLAPALVSSRADIEHYNISDASPVSTDSSTAPKGYVERFIHSEIYKKYPGVHSVVHSHAEAVLPFSISSTPLRPVFHMGGVMGGSPAVPVWDIAAHYKGSADEVQALLVGNEQLGAALAAGFNAAPPDPSSGMMAKGVAKGYNIVKGLVTKQDSDFPSSPTVLMRGHGFTCVGTRIEEAVYRAVYTATNARVQTTALLMQGTFNLGLVAEGLAGKKGEEGEAKGLKVEEIRYLSERECGDSWKALSANAERPWKLWCEEVKVGGLYRNELLE